MNKNVFKKKFEKAIKKKWLSDIPKVSVELNTGERVVATDYTIYDFGNLTLVKLKYEGLGSENYEYEVLLRDIVDVY